MKLFQRRLLRATSARPCSRPNSVFFEAQPLTAQEQPYRIVRYGNTAFGHTEGNCVRCHTGPSSDGRQVFKQFRKSLKLPKAPFGNKIDWVGAQERGLIRPTNSILEPGFEPIPFNEKFKVPAAWTLIPPADFSHNVHLQWLECSNCHPDIFKIKKRATQHFLMKNILDGKFCGACHMTVAFPLNDCKRCHPDMKG